MYMSEACKINKIEFTLGNHSLIVVGVNTNTVTFEVKSILTELGVT